MKIGKMRHYITFQRKENVENEIGSVNKDWKDYKSTWAEKIRLRNSTVESLGKEGIEETYRFKVRYREDITEDMRIVYKNVVYGIAHVNNIDELDMYETHIDVKVLKEGNYDE